MNGLYRWLMRRLSCAHDRAMTLRRGMLIETPKSGHQQGAPLEVKMPIVYCFQCGESMPWWEYVARRVLHGRVKTYDATKAEVYNGRHD